MAKAAKGKGTEPATPTVEQELLKATGEKVQGKDESSDDYLTRVAEKVFALPEEKYDSLSATARGWYEEFAEASNQKKSLPAFPAAAAAADDDGEHQPEGEEMETATATEGKGKGKAKATKAPAAKKEAAKPAAKKEVAKKAEKPAAKATKKATNGAAKKEPKPRAESGSTKVMVATCKDLKASVDVILTRTKAAGVAESQVRSIYRLTHSVVNAAREAGLIK